MQPIHEYLGKFGIRAAWRKTCTQRGLNELPDCCLDHLTRQYVQIKKTCPLFLNPGNSGRKLASFGLTLHKFVTSEEKRYYKNHKLFSKVYLVSANFKLFLQIVG